jgi:branched-chain amino acid transport system substrate-binding protein
MSASALLSPGTVAIQGRGKDHDHAEIITQAFATTTGIKDNLVGPSPNVPYYANIPANTAMNQAVDKYYPGLRSDPSKWSELVSEAWPSGILFEDAAKAGGLGANGSTPTSAQLISGLHALKNDTLQEMASPLNFVAGQANPDHCWYTFSLKNGVYGLPNGTGTTCEQG